MAEHHPPGTGPRDGQLEPTLPDRREPVLDVLRGFALLGILLVNIELMRGPTFFRVLAGDLPDPSEGLDRVLQFGVGWLATGKFISSFALLFGVGAALIAARATAGGTDPRRVLARRYGWLLLIGLAHMILLFPGDILLIYGLAGLLLVAFLSSQPRTLLGWGGGLIGGMTLLAVTSATVGAALGGMQTPADDPLLAGLSAVLAEQAEATTAAHLDGSYLDILAVNAVAAAIVQVGQLFTVPWILGLFLLGFWVGRSGLVADLEGHRPQLRLTAVLGLGLGLPLTVAQGAVDPIVQITGAAGAVAGPGLVALTTLGQQLGAPILALGYLSTLALLSLRLGVLGPLAAVGRMALTAYLLQSLLALVVFAGFDRYAQLGPAPALLVVVGIWLVLLVVCPLWLRWFRFGPVEWLWRSLTYGARQPLRSTATP